MCQDIPTLIKFWASRLSIGPEPGRSSCSKVLWKCRNHWAEPGRIFKRQAALSWTLLKPGWDGTMKVIPGQRKISCTVGCTYHSLVLGCPIPGILILRYLPLIWNILFQVFFFWDIPKTSKDTPGISSTWSYPWPILEIYHRYPKKAYLF